MADVAVFAVAAFFAAMGLVALAQPERVPAGFGGTAPTPEARNEVRAVYGGFGLAVAAALVWATGESEGIREGVLAAIGVALAGMAAGRVVSALIERPRGGYVWLWFAVEVALAAVLLASA